MRFRTVYIVLGIAPLRLLAVPTLAMVFTDNVNWGLEDFAVAAVLIFGLGISIAFVRKKFNRPVWIICVITLLFLLLWAELAVGVFGSLIAEN
jgi:hypothetical protein